MSKAHKIVVNLNKAGDSHFLLSAIVLKTKYHNPEQWGNIKNLQTTEAFAINEAKQWGKRLEKMEKAETVIVNILDKKETYNEDGKIHSQIQYRHPTENHWIHSDTCPKDCKLQNINQEYREHIHRILDEFLDNVQAHGEGYFYIGNHKHIEPLI